MNPNTCMKRLLDGIKAQSHSEVDEATRELAKMLEQGELPPYFDSKMAGKDKWGNQRLYLRLGQQYAIQTVSHLGTKEGWEFVTYNFRGDKLWSKKLADKLP